MEKEDHGNIEELLRAKATIEEQFRQFQQFRCIMFTDIKGSTEYFSKKGDIAGRTLIQKHNDLLFPLIEHNIGAVYHSQGQSQEALTYYEKAREIQERLGLDVDLAATYFNLGLLYKAQGDLDKAEEYVSRTVHIEEKIGHPDLEDHRAVLESIRRQKSGT